jgi:hypothetical protein
MKYLQPKGTAKFFAKIRRKGEKKLNFEPYPIHSSSLKNDLPNSNDSLSGAHLVTGACISVKINDMIVINYRMIKSVNLDITLNHIKYIFFFAQNISKLLL